ncbi:nucleotide exchange factor GrpE [soil metagenome]
MSEPFEDVPLNVDGPAVDVATLQSDLDKAQRKIADYMSVVADFDNSRKRLVQDAERTRKYAHEGLSRDLLGALDNLDRAVEAAAKAGEKSGLVDGVKATTSLFLDILKRYGVTKMDIKPGTPFDPNQHQAVMQQPSTEVAAGSVIQVLQQGFMLHDRVLRPASVIVAAGES